MASDRKPMKFITSSTFQKADNLEIYKKNERFSFATGREPSPLQLNHIEFRIYVSRICVGGLWYAYHKRETMDKSIIIYSWSKVYLIYRNEFLLFLNVNKYKQNTSCDILHNSVILIPVIPSDISRMTRTHTRISD